MTLYPHRFGIMFALMGAALIAAIFVVTLTVVRTRYVTYHSVKHVPISYGQPSQVIDGAQVNPQLAGWTCSVYAAKHTIVCK